MKRKGFTLIELLAVIVVLAVIALIATPIVLRLVDNAKKGAVEASINNYIHALESAVVASELNGENKLKPNQTYNVTTGTTIDGVYYAPINEYVNMRGKIPTGIEDKITLDENKSVSSARLNINGYEVEINDGKIVNIEKGKIIDLEEIELNGYEQTMERGSSYEITATFNPINTSNQELTYESSNKDIVTVDETGKVTAISNGEAEITVIPKANKNKKKIVKIKVVSPEAVTGITLNKEEVTIGIGEKYELEATLEPMDATSNSLEWTSSNDTVATVSSGEITGISVGEAIITATTQNGLTAQMKVYVKYEITLNGEKKYTTDSSIVFENVDITNKTNISCNNGATFTLETKTLTINNIKGNVTCQTNSSLESTVNSLDNTENYILMINDESFTNAITIAENKKVTLDLNEKMLQYNGSGYAIENFGILNINGNNSSFIGTGKSVRSNNNSNLIINGGLYNYINARGSSILSIKNTTNQCTVNKNDCYPIILEGNTNSTFENIKVEGSLGKSFGMTGNANATVKNSSFECVADNCVWFNSIGNLKLDNVEIDAYGYGVSNNYGTLDVINSEINAAVNGSSTSAINHNSNALITNIINTTIESYNGSLYVNGSGNINIYDSNLHSASTSGIDCVYINSNSVNTYITITNTSIESDGSHGVKNDGTANININNSNVTANSSAVVNSKEGIIKVNGGIYTVDGTGYQGAISNRGEGTINICSGTVNGLTTNDKYDLYNLGTGYIKYKSGVLLKNNTIYDTNNPSQVIIDDTITCG